MGHTHTLDCKEVLAKLYDYIDGEIDAADRDAFQAHLELCRPCLSYYEFERYFTQFVKERSPHECVRADFKAGLLARLSEERRLLEDPPQERAAKASFALLLPRFALAAVIVLAIGIGTWYMGHRTAQESVNWALLTSYHMGTSGIEEDGLDTPEFVAARSFILSRFGPAHEPLLPHAMPPGITSEAACVLPWGNDRLAQLEWLDGTERISMFVIPIDTLSPAMEPEHRPRIGFPDHDYHMFSAGDLRALCWKVGKTGTPMDEQKTHMKVLMGATSYDTLLKWAEALRQTDSAWSSDASTRLDSKSGE